MSWRRLDPHDPSYRVMPMLFTSFQNAANRSFILLGETFNNLAYHKKATINRGRFPPKPVPFTVDGAKSRNPAFRSNKGSFMWRVDLGNRCQISSVTLALMKMPKSKICMCDYCIDMKL